MNKQAVYRTAGRLLVWGHTNFWRSCDTERRRISQHLSSYNLDIVLKYHNSTLVFWLQGWLGRVLRLHQHSIGYTGDGFYRSKDPTNSIKVLKAHTDYTFNRKTQ